MIVTSSGSNALTPAAATSPNLDDSETDPNMWSVMKVGLLSLTSVTVSITVVCAGGFPFGRPVVPSSSVAYNKVQIRFHHTTVPPHTHILIHSHYPHSHS